MYVNVLSATIREKVYHKNTFYHLTPIRKERRKNRKAELIINVEKMKSWYTVNAKAVAIATMENSGKVSQETKG